MPESVSTRAAAVVGVAGFGLAAVLAGAVLAAGGSASAAATCAASTPTESPTDEPTATDSPSAEPSDTSSPVPSSTTNSNGSILQAVTDLLPLGNGQGTTTGSPEPTSTDSATPAPTSTASTTVTLAPRRVVKGDPVRITGSGLPGCHVQVLGYSRPNTTYKVVRNGTIADNGKFSFTVYPPSNTRVYARSQGANDSTSTTVNVRFVVSLKITRVGVKTYRFEGGVGPGAAGVHVTVYRAVKGGNPVKVGTADTASNGAYSLVHQFSGTGTFTFYAVAGTTANNDSNRSALVQSSIS